MWYPNSYMVLKCLGMKFLVLSIRSCIKLLVSAKDPIKSFIDSCWENAVIEIMRAETDNCYAQTLLSIAQISTLSSSLWYWKSIQKKYMYEKQEHDKGDDFVMKHICTCMCMKQYQIMIFSFCFITMHIHIFNKLKKTSKLMNNWIVKKDQYSLHNKICQIFGYAWFATNRLLQILASDIANCSLT